MVMWHPQYATAHYETPLRFIFPRTKIQYTSQIQMILAMKVVECGVSVLRHVTFEENIPKVKAEIRIPMHKEG
jgi:hypothetical protein